MGKRLQTWRRRRAAAQLLSAALLGVALLLVAAVTGLAATPTIEATGASLSSYAWTPSTAEVDSGGSVNFKNPTGTSHGLVWESGPETPSCTGTPGVGEANWSGSCSFAQGGTYSFYCPVHPTRMKGTITVAGPAAPVVVTGSASAISESEATLDGTVNPSGQAATYFFEYGTSTAYGQHTGETPAGEGTTAEPESATVSGLSPATTYHFRIVAKNPTGTTLGTDHTFQTDGPPSATTGAATTVGITEATLTGSVRPNGFATTYFFNYGTTSAYGQKTAETAAGSGRSAMPASAPLTGLGAGTTYHFQLVAKNASGTTAGTDATFTTKTVPPSQPPLTGPASTPPPSSLAPTPDTRITLKPRARTSDRTPTFRFTATIAGAAFRCSVDGRRFKNCSSPYTMPTLKPGHHRIRVVAVANGAADPTPAVCSFKVLAAKR
jgi:plastocyanin